MKFENSKKKQANNKNRECMTQKTRKNNNIRILNQRFPLK